MGGSFPCGNVLPTALTVSACLRLPIILLLRVHICAITPCSSQQSSPFLLQHDSLVSKAARVCVFVPKSVSVRGELFSLFASLLLFLSVFSCFHVFVCFYVSFFFVFFFFFLFAFSFLFLLVCFFS